MKKFILFIVAIFSANLSPKEKIETKAFAALDTFQNAINQLMAVNTEAVALVEQNETTIDRLTNDNKALNSIIEKHTKVASNIARLIGED